MTPEPFQQMQYRGNSKGQEFLCINAEIRGHKPFTWFMIKERTPYVNSCQLIFAGTAMSLTGIVVWYDARRDRYMYVKHGGHTAYEKLYEPELKYLQDNWPEYFWPKEKAG